MLVPHRMELVRMVVDQRYGRHVGKGAARLGAVAGWVNGYVSWGDGWVLTVNCCSGARNGWVLTVNCCSGARNGVVALSETT